MFFQDAAGRDVPMKGEFWIDPRSGAVVRIQFAIETAGPTQGDSGLPVRQSLATAIDYSRMRVEVSFKRDPALGVNVPVEMKETFSTDVPGPQIEGVGQDTRRELSCTATYTNYRRLESR